MDFFRCPFQYFLNYILSFSNEEKTLNSIKITREIEENIKDVKVVLHHFAPRELSFTKKIGNKEYKCGLQAALMQLNLQKVDCICFVADSDEDYFLKLKNTFKNITFKQVRGDKFDFYSYLSSSEPNKTINYYCMFNDNVDLRSNIIDFIKAAKTSFSVSNIGILGVGSNSRLTQSIFSNSFRPHVQAYGFFIEKQIFDEFVKKFKWFLSSKEPNFLAKQACCRVLEQGLSKITLNSGLSIGFFRNKSLLLYTRTFKGIDLKKDWYTLEGDSREKLSSPFLFAHPLDLPLS